MTYKLLLAGVATGASAAVLAACGSGYATNRSPAQPPAPSKSTMVTLAKTPVGPVVVDGSGRTLYLFNKDASAKSRCSGTCASLWPPFTATSVPKVAGGVAASQLSLVTRPDGRRQVALAGHPLYFFSGDSAAGDVKGQGLTDFGARWWTVAPDGTSVTKAAAAGAGSSSGSGSGW